MTSPTPDTHEADRATDDLLSKLGLTVDAGTRSMLSLAWLAGFNAGLDYCNERLEQAGVR